MIYLINLNLLIFKLVKAQEDYIKLALSYL
jgi:hypothetical protein